MAKLKLVPNPTFDAAVEIPLHGGTSEAVRFTFIHRPTSKIQSWLESVKEKSVVDVVMEASSAWDLDDKFTRENVEQLLDNYAGAGDAILQAYIRELSQARIKN